VGGPVFARLYVRVRVHGRGCLFARVALLIQHATRRHFAICGFSGLTMFFELISQKARSSGGKKVAEYKMCILIFCIILFETFLILRRI
jgi:hypothetical protein